jgi:hypothetical protein
VLAVARKVGVHLLWHGRVANWMVRVPTFGVCVHERVAKKKIMTHLNPSASSPGLLETRPELLETVRIESMPDGSARYGQQTPQKNAETNKLYRNVRNGTE